MRKTLDKPVPKNPCKKIRFCLEKKSMDCFISKRSRPDRVLRKDSYEDPSKHSLQKKSPQKEDKVSQQRQQSSCKLQLRLTSIGNPEVETGSPPKVNCHRFFNTQLLLLQYDDNEVYIDSVTHNKPVRSKEPANDSVSENDDETEEFISSCIRVITQETTHTENPLSARGFIDHQEHQEHQEYHNEPMSNTHLNPYTLNSHTHKKSYTIELDRILNDGRTTIMVRNIPNKYTQQLLIELFSQNHRKKFDFIYLPIDHKNNCNVGYAFVNFIHAKFINDFYHEFHHQKWKLFNSEKICQVCYARIQGTSQLTNHFESTNLPIRDFRGRYTISDRQFGYPPY